MVLEGNVKVYLKFWQVTLSRVFSVKNIVTDVKYYSVFYAHKLSSSSNNSLATPNTSTKSF